VVDHAAVYPPGSTEPVVATLLWPGGDVPAAEEMARLPLLVEESPFSRRKPVVRLTAVNSPPRGELALQNFGEVVASGVIRPDAPDHRRSGTGDGPLLSYWNWRGLAEGLDGESHKRSVELTTKELRRRGSFGRR
jgi:hypothetical protein